MFRTLIDTVLHVARIAHICLTVVDLHHAYVGVQGILALLSILNLDQILNLIFASEELALYGAKCKTWCVQFLEKSQSGAES